MTSLLTARGITKRFGALPVLHGIDLDVEPGEFVAIMGPSGSGKSTLLYALSGMDQPSGGSVRFDGTELTGLTQAELGSLRLTRMGFVFQQVHLLRNLSLLDNVVLPGFLAQTRTNRTRVVERGRELMRRAGVGELTGRDLTEASGGQLQRVGICRALINDPSIIFADEPTGALDSVAADAVMDLLDGMRAPETSLVMVTHDARVAARAGRVVGLVDGRLGGELRPRAADRDAREEEIAQWLRGLHRAVAA